MPTNPGSSFRLRDGRNLGYLELGAPDGSPVFLTHGSPGSRLDALLADPAHFAARTARVIVPDRPGLGLSDFKAPRTFADHAADMAELADALGVDRFAVMGISGGGPYAAACAVALPDRVSAVAIVSGMAPLSVPGNTEGMGSSRHFIRLARRLPWLVRALMAPLGRMASDDPDRAGERLAGSFGDVDRKLLRTDPRLRAAFLATIAEAFRQGARGAVADLAMYARPLGFDPADVRVPTQIWQGEADTNVPPAMARFWERAIPGATARFFPGEGHLMFLQHLPEILEALTGAATRPDARREASRAG